MRSLKNSTIKVKIVTLIAVNSFFIVMGGLLVFIQTTRIVDSTKNLQVNFQSLVHQGQLDMMHDAIRGDVYGALLPNSDPNAAQNQLDEHSNIGLTEIEKIQKISNQAHIRDGYANAKPVYSNYVNSAKKIIDQAKADKTVALANVQDFEKAYVLLEDELGKLGESVNKVSSQDNHSVEDLVNELLMMLGGIFLIAIPISSMLGYRINKLISPRIASLVHAAEAILKGNYSVHLDEQYQDDIGELTKAFNKMKRDLQDRLEGANLMMKIIIDMTTDQRNTETALETMLRGMMNIVKAKYAAAAVFHGDGSIEKFVTVGMSDAQIKGISHLPQGKGLLGYLQHSQKSLRLADMSKHPNSAGFPSGHPPMKSLLAAPIMFGKISVGNVYFTEKEGGEEFSEYDEDTVRIISQLAGIVISDRRTKHDLRGIIGQIQELSSSLADSIQSISGATEELAAGAREQSGQAIDVAAAVEEMANNIIETANSAGQTAEFAKSNGDLAGDGQKIVENTINKMRHIADVVRESEQTVQRLGDAGTSIGEIVSVISDIADQTNLLALNAAIEAARAGEQGRGFAVVADEVRKLAERTTVATKQIRDMIQSIQKETTGAVRQMQEGSREVQEGIALADNAGDALKQVVRSAGQMYDLVNTIASAAQEQSSTSDTIARNVTAISTISTESASTIMDVARNVTELSQLAEVLKELTSQVDLAGQTKSNGTSKIQKQLGVNSSPRLLK